MIDIETQIVTQHQRDVILPREDEAVAVCRGRRRRRRECANEEERQDSHTPRPFLARHFSAHSLPPFVGDVKSLSRISAVRGCASIRDTNVSQRTATTDGFLGPSCCCVSSVGRGGGIDGRTPLLPPPAFPSSSTVAEKGPRPPIQYVYTTGTFSSCTVGGVASAGDLSQNPVWPVRFSRPRRCHTTFRPCSIVRPPLSPCQGAWGENATHAWTGVHCK